jgi:hypothetical protein
MGRRPTDSSSKGITYLYPAVYTKSIHSFFDLTLTETHYMPTLAKHWPYKGESEGFLTSKNA